VAVDLTSLWQQLFGDDIPIDIGVTATGLPLEIIGGPEPQINFDPGPYDINIQFKLKQPR
jgi:hypothetical protein